MSAAISSGGFGYHLGKDLLIYPVSQLVEASGDVHLTTLPRMLRRLRMPSSGGPHGPTADRSKERHIAHTSEPAAEKAKSCHSLAYADYREHLPQRRPTGSTNSQVATAPPPVAGEKGAG